MIRFSSQLKQISAILHVKDGSGKDYAHKHFPKVVQSISPLQKLFMKYYYNPFWYGGPLNGGDAFDGPFGGFAPNPFARPKSPSSPDDDMSTTTPEGPTADSTPTTTAVPPPTTSMPPPPTLYQNPYKYYYNYYVDYKDDYYEDDFYF